jgi:hypothetical protein
MSILFQERKDIFAPKLIHVVPAVGKTWGIDTIGFDGCGGLMR